MATRRSWWELVSGTPPKYRDSLAATILPSGWQGNLVIRFYSLYKSLKSVWNKYVTLRLRVFVAVRNFWNNSNKTRKLWKLNWRAKLLRISEMIRYLWKRKISGQLVINEFVIPRPIFKGTEQKHVRCLIVDLNLTPHNLQNIRMYIESCCVN